LKIMIFCEPSNLLRGEFQNFKGAVRAAERLRTTQEWQTSAIIFSSPDSAQKEVREFALIEGKTLIMASPNLKNGYLLINPKLKTEKRSQHLLKELSSLE